jgi:diacylglycerol O-acyltransferase / wax synthase
VSAMAETFYERLSGLDRCFLAFESPASPMHIGIVMTVEAAPLARQDGGADFERLARYAASRLDRLPRYRQRIAPTPLGGRLIWIDDPHFNLYYHLRHTSLPRPGDERQLKRLCGRIMSQPLDASKPLWELWIVEGLDQGRMALIMKVHHCMVDGLAGVGLLAHLLDVAPSSEIPDPLPWTPRPAPGALELLLDAALGRARLPLDLAQAAGRALLSPVQALAVPLQQMRAAWRTLEVGLKPAASTPLNREVGPHRRFDWLAMDLGAIKQTARGLGGTINDLVLAIVAGALRRFFQGRGFDPQGLRFRVAAPVSLRPQADRGITGNRVSFWFVELPVGESDPRRRFAQIHEQSETMKRSREVVHSDVIATLADWAGPALVARGAHVVMGARPFNLVVTNLPGPQVPLYLLEARVLASYPLVPLFANLAMGIALFSYDGRLHWGLNADWDEMSDLHVLVLGLEAAFEELRSAV